MLPLAAVTLAAVLLPFVLLRPIVFPGRDPGHLQLKSLKGTFTPGESVRGLTAMVESPIELELLRLKNMFQTTRNTLLSSFDLKLDLPLE